MTGREYCPIVSPDGKDFFFTSPNVVASFDISEKLTIKKIKQMYETVNKQPQYGEGDIYWVDAKIINEYRNKN